MRKKQENLGGGFWKDNYGGMHPLAITKSVTEREESATFETNELEQLIALKDMEDEIANALLDKFGTISKIKKATKEELEEISGIGNKRAKSIWKQLKEL